MQVNGGAAVTRTYNAADQITNAGYTYDLAGNLLTDGTLTYTYDALNRTKTLAGAQSRTYTYNGDGVLVRQVAGATTTDYTQDLASPLSQVLQSKVGATTTHYLYGLERLAVKSGATRTWYLGDALGSVRRTLNDSGAATAAVFYDPWGTVESGTVPTFGFTGELQDVAAGLVNLRARWYSTGKGTFTSRDTWGGDSQRSQTLNPYSYVGNNPVNLTDASGQCYPPLELLRQIEPDICHNLDKAIVIQQKSEPGSSERAVSSGFISLWIVGHAAALVGGGILTAEAVVGSWGGVTAISQWGASHVVAGTTIGQGLTIGGAGLSLGSTAYTIYQAANGDTTAQAFLACPPAFGVVSFWDDLGNITRAGIQAATSLGAQATARVGIIVRPRGTLGSDDAGHFAVYTDIDGDIQVRGFWPQKEGLPGDPDELFDTLFNNRFPGEARNDANMLKHVDLPGVIHAQRSVSLEEAQRLRTLLGDAGPRDSFYSFNPDNFSNTYNCVTWGCTQINQVLESIPIPRQGRVKLVLDVIKNLAEPWQITIGGGP